MKLPVAFLINAYTFDGKTYKLTKVIDCKNKSDADFEIQNLREIDYDLVVIEEIVNKKSHIHYV
ncbi:MAG: hypothetical protein N2235_01425 [Fischerella sp.]|nr:hypothetical protein [Fischerella sp.]